MVEGRIEVFDQLGWVKVTSCANLCMLPCPGYDATAAKLAWERTIAHFNKYVRG